MINRILPNYYFSLECLYVYFLLCLFNFSSNQLPPLFSFLSVCLVGNISLFFILQQKQVTQLIPFLTGIVAGGIGYVLGFNQITAIACACFLFFRMKSFSIDSSLWIEERHKFQVLFYCSGLFILFYGWIVNYSYMNVLYGISIGFTVLFSFGRFLQQAVHKDALKNVHGLFGALSIAVILASIVTVFIPTVKWGIFKLLDGLLGLVGFMAAPLFNLLEKIQLQPKLKGEEEELRQNLDKLPQTQKDNIIISDIPSWSWLIIFILICIMIGVYLYKFKFIKVEQTLQQSPLEIDQLSFKENTKIIKRFFNYSAPSDHIRKLIFQLQKFALKHDLGRHEHETLNEWFQRAEFQHHQDLLHAYEQVRYGNGILEHNEKYYEKEFQTLKKEIKDRTKDKAKKN
ncbi:DUF4129 domain-containing protein [Gottfriedia solisilvae]|uniref:DUF4129 domain-containing protein n=1 Tax=Gottfriedia solisilvae TaxID=1516104 RepID=A0A8J3AJR5_9BACI|nr:DUF4129 domain-containing protein [Gottfriedia solisilvae]GGI14783.1 hypothetical protein GCM10007380_24680 [Gottfriedia solisilvae]